MFNSIYHPLSSSNKQSFELPSDRNSVDSKNLASSGDSQDVQMEEANSYRFESKKEFNYTSPFFENPLSNSTSPKTTSGLSSQTDEFISKISMNINSLIQPFSNGANASKSLPNNGSDTLTTSTITSSNKEPTFPDSFPLRFPSVYKSTATTLDPLTTTGLSAIRPPSSLLTSSHTHSFLSNTIGNPVSVSVPIGAKGGFTLEEAKEAPVKSLYDICAYRRLPIPVFESKITGANKSVPIQMFGTDVTVRGKTYSTPIAYTSKKHAKAAAALLGLHALGVPVDVDSIYNKKPPAPVVQDHGQAGSSSDSYFTRLNRLLQRHGLVVPLFTTQCVATLPAKHECTFLFQGHRFTATASKKPDARQLCAKQALEYLSALPDFIQPPTDYPVMLGKYAQSKKWPSPRYFNPTAEGNKMPLDQVHLGVTVNGYTFVRSLGTEYTQTAAKRVVAKDAYEFLLSEEATASISASNATSSCPLERAPVPATAPAEGEQTFTSKMDLEELTVETHSAMQTTMMGDAKQGNESKKNHAPTLANVEQPASTPSSNGVVLTSSSSLNFPTLTPVTSNPWESNTAPSFPNFPSSTTTSSPKAHSTSATPTVEDPFANPSTVVTKPHISFVEEPPQAPKNYIKLLKLVKKYQFCLIEQLIPVENDSTQETLWFSRFAVYRDKGAKDRLVLSNPEKPYFREPLHAMECAALNTLYALKELISKGTIEARELK